MSDPTDRPLRLVLDTSAIAAWTRGSISVGELLAEIDLEHGAIVVPLPCLIEAGAQTAADNELLDVLIGHPATVVLADEPDGWRMLVGLRQILGSADLASAAWNALDTGLDVLTAHSRLYADLGGGSLAIQIED